MAWRNIQLYLLILLFTWIYAQASCEVDVSCWWNRSRPVLHNVSVVCRESGRRSPNNCSLCQLHIISNGLALPSTCAGASDSLRFSIAAEQTENISCTCPGETAETCNVTVQGGYPPSPPSRPDCVIEDENEDISCSWTKSTEPPTPTPTVYTLHWQNEDGMVSSRQSGGVSALIHRAEYTKSTVTTAWVTAQNILGEAQSEESIFNTGNIKRPDPPDNINLTASTPLEIAWDMDCDIVGPLDKLCQVQYSTDNQDWTEVDNCQTMFQLENPQPFTLYSFRVRCHCGYEERVMSDWSVVHEVRTPPAAPVGYLDVWSDCSPDSDRSSCNMYWKEMPLSQARGEITNYIVTLKLINGTEIKQVSRQKRDTEGHSCPPIGRFPLQPGEFLGVYVSANTTMGTSDPTILPFPVNGPTPPEVSLNVIGEKQTLLASWSVYPKFSESVLEYVLQYESVGPNRPCLNWTRVNRSQRSVRLTGDFMDYTAYNVSLFAVFNNYSTFLKSAIGYTLQGVPPEVPQFEVKNISDSSATLSWSSIPLHKSNGVVLHYLVGINETGMLVSGDRTIMHLSELQASRQYQVWVCAVSAAGQGARTTTSFSTIHKHSVVALILIPVFAVFLSIFIAALACHLTHYCSEKIPDPINSKSFTHMNFQHVWPRMCPPSELTLKISELEIMENPDPPASASETKPNEALLDDAEPTHFHLPAGLNRTGGAVEKWEESRCERQESCNKEYSEMVDIDEEERDNDDEWWEQGAVSDYERHFMPSVEAS